MATAAQLKANRENGSKSHGPVSEQGKETSCMNNFRHGLTGHRFFFIEGEQPELYDKLLAELKKQYNPQNETEELLVQTMAQSNWLSQRANTMQSGSSPEDYHNFGIYLEHLHRLARYQAQHLRAFNQALNQLLKLRAETRKEQIGFESKQRSEAAEARRQETQNQRNQMFKTRHATAEIRREHAQINFLKNFDKLPPAELAQLAAALEKKAA